jgi:hypothetical protein
MLGPFFVCYGDGVTILIPKVWAFFSLIYTKRFRCLLGSFSFWSNNNNTQGVGFLSL